jgi:threonine/homoserine/homoserine lactone efflux protein
VLTTVSPYFLATSLLVIVSPGPDAVLAVHLVLRSGRRAPAFAGAAGMVTAGAGHALLALTGVSVVMRGNPAVWTAMRWTGAAVLLVWGVRALAAACRPAGGQDAAGPEGPHGSEGRFSLRRSYGLGLLSTGSNPKVGVFLLAYLPQFAGRHDPAQRTVALLAAVYLALAAAWLTVLIVSTDLLRTRGARRQERDAGRRGRWRQAAEGVLGVLFLGFAVRLAWAG